MTPRPCASLLLLLLPLLLGPGLGCGSDPVSSPSPSDATATRQDMSAMVDLAADKDARVDASGMRDDMGDQAAFLCPQDQRVQAKACVPCPPGDTNEPGDDASGPDTQCDDACSPIFGVLCAQVAQTYLKAANTNELDAFGRAVALSGDTLVVGAPEEDSKARGSGGDQTDNSAENSGAAYVFVRNGATWTQQAYLKASNSEESDQFGSALAIQGDTLVVGAPGEDSKATGANGDQMNNLSSASGAAYVFVRSGTVWTQQAYLKASNPGTGDQFGNALAIQGDTLVVGAQGEDSKATGVDGDQMSSLANGSGAAYVFTRTATTWAQQAYLKASNTDASDGFGGAVALSKDTLVVSAPAESSSIQGVVGGNQADNSAIRSGAVYVFTRTATTWAQQAYLKASNSEGDDAFGRTVALEADTLAVGAFGESSKAQGIGGNQADNSAIRSGAVYVFTRTATTWAQQAYLKASNSEGNDEFGGGLALAGDTLVVGANKESSKARGIAGDQTDNSAARSGAAYVFARSGTTWAQQVYLKAPNAEESDDFGRAIACDGRTVAIGARREDSKATGIGGDQADNSAESSGAVYVYEGAP